MALYTVFEAPEAGHFLNKKLSFVDRAKASERLQSTVGPTSIPLPQESSTAEGLGNERFYTRT
ncbi:unnamed protein product [Prunus armeniaca]|uniref:Uncharacterized protein n=1 Tax=Prunus armeniaca TaxID=36596 RepID=A0A6J5WZ60_PRUAR|nr:unnamed protein product [Prunus armeniaca]